MKFRNPIALSTLALVAVFALLVTWEFAVEPRFVNPDEPAEERWEVIVAAMVCTVLALIVPTWIAYRDDRNRTQAEARLSDAIETIPDGFVLYDADGRLVVCNKRFRDFYSYSDEEAKPGVTRSGLGELDARRGVTIDGAGGEEYRKRRRDFRIDPIGEQELRLADGRYILTRERVTADGGLVSVQSDITDLKFAERTLAESEAKLRTSIENMADAFVYFDAEGRLALCNENYRKLYGYTEEEVRTGTTRVELGNIDRVRGVIGDGDAAESFLELRSSQLSHGTREMEFRFSDGRWILSRARKLADGGVVSIQADITELKAAQMALAESEQRLLDAIESLEEGFIYFDSNDRLVVANSKYKDMFPAQYKIEPGVSFEDSIRMSIDAGEVPLAVGQEAAWMERRLQQHRELQRVDEQHLADGRWVRISEKRTSDGGSVGLRTDITELKETQMAAEAANRAKTAFLANMSHELRTPLNSIIGFSEVLREEIFEPLPTKYKEYADNIHVSGVHLLALITDILDISRIEVGEMQAATEDVDVAEVIADCVAMMRPRAEGRDLQLNADGIDGAPILRVDPRHLKQMLINLISNAVKFTPSGGAVIVNTVVNTAGALRITVTDTGIGIAPADQARVFLPFAQVDNPETRVQEGTGLGLYLVKSLAELNGGHVSMVSQIAEGTTVTITFPGDSLVRVA